VTRWGTAAVLTPGDTIGDLESEISLLDPDVDELIAEAEAIVSAAVRRPPTKTGYGAGKPGRLFGRALRCFALRRGPVRPVRAAERGPPV
jgi:hypothetical protein